MRIFTTIDLTPTQAARVQQALGDDTLFQSRDFSDEAGERKAFDACEIAFGNPPAAWVGASAALRWVQLESVGFNAYLDLDWAKLTPRLRVTNLAGFFDEPAAESILAGVLALYRRIDLFVSERERAHWAGDVARPGMRTLKGANVVLLGFGAINRRVAELLAPFGCKLTPIRRGETGALDAALPAADLVIATVPDTPATRNLLDRKRLAAMKPGAILANFGRGSLVDEDALADELECGRLGGAVIDVTREEPLPEGHRFWRSPNLILTQHTGGGNHDEIDRKITRFIENLALYRRGEAAHWRDRPRARLLMPKIQSVRCVLLSSPYADADDPEIKECFPNGPEAHHRHGRADARQRREGPWRGLSRGVRAAGVSVDRRPLPPLCRRPRRRRHRRLGAAPAQPLRLLVAAGRRAPRH